MNIKDINTPVLGFLAHSGTGKTTLLIKLITILSSNNLKIGIIKHAHHQFEIDQPKKDSYRLRKAGATEMLIGSKKRWALMADATEQQEFSLDDHIQRMQQDKLDLILVEGFDLEKIPKIELFRPALGKVPFFKENDEIIAVATDEPLTTEKNLPILSLNDTHAIVTFIYQQFLH